MAYTLKERKTNIQKNIKYKSTVLASCTWYSRMLVAPDSQSVLSERFAGFTSIFTFAWTIALKYIVRNKFSMFSYCNTFSIIVNDVYVSWAAYRLVRSKWIFSKGTTATSPYDLTTQNKQKIAPKTSRWRGCTQTCSPINLLSDLWVISECSLCALWVISGVLSVGAKNDRPNDGTLQSLLLLAC